jgi:hypothetical protein
MEVEVAMSGRVICQSCGERFEVEVGFRRAKMQCPVCGVMVPIPESARTAAPETTAKAPARSAPPPKDDVPSSFWDDVHEPSTPSHQQEEDDPPAPPVEKSRARPQPQGPTCCHCGTSIRVRARHGPPERCPNCGEAWDRPAPPIAADGSVVPHLELDEATETEDDDGTPYDLAGGSRIEHCPACKGEIPRGARVCISCGYDRKKKKKIAKVYEEMRRHWENGMPYPTRLALFVCTHAFVLLLGLVTALMQSDTVMFVIAWVVFLGMTAFLMGTFDHLDLERDRKGKVKLTKTWYFCFIPQAPLPIDVRGHEGVVTGRVNEHGFYEWFIFLILLGYGLVPGIVWWYVAIHRDTFSVALSRDHGFPATSLYVGASQDQMTDIAVSISNATSLPYFHS